MNHLSAFVPRVASAGLRRAAATTIIKANKTVSPQQQLASLYSSTCTFNCKPVNTSPFFSVVGAVRLFSNQSSTQQQQQQQQQPVSAPSHVPTDATSGLEPGAIPSRDQGADYSLPHPIWKGALNNVQITFKPRKNRSDELAYWVIQTIRFNFDLLSGYSFGRLTPRKVSTRVLFLESIAGIPGAIGGVLRHLASLRNIRRDNGWIHTLYEEAENERMHLLVAKQLEQPVGPFMRVMLFLSQGVFYNFFFAAYLISPHFCHRLVGYLEEQAVLTYQHVIDEIDTGSLKQWGATPAPPLAISYWRMPTNATIRDMILQLRADEAHHRDVNHTFGDMPLDGTNPFKAGY